MKRVSEANAQKTNTEWTDQEKAQLAQQAQMLRRQGQTWKAVVEQTGVSEWRLRAWMKKNTDFVPVIIEPPIEELTEAENEQDVLFTMTTPSGYRFEGLDVGTATVLIEMLR